ncbi:Acetyltransferase (GNAT) domain protein [uncultured archaeon]|nr:Acetyltransferase (GNAT) domain protein [uncultured archaeon]
MNDIIDSFGNPACDSVRESIRVEIVKHWDEQEIVGLYGAAGWWKEGMDPGRIPELILGSFLFAVAIDISTGKAVGTGRVISDGVADAYIQDLVVLARWRGSDVGRMIVSALLDGCRAHKLSWVGLIAEPGTEGFYSSIGFSPMVGYIPMLYSSILTEAV